MIAALILTLVLIIYRVVLGTGHAQIEWLPNFSPLAAIVLCAAIYFPKKTTILIPLGALVVSDIFLNLHFGASIFALDSLLRYFALGGIFSFARMFAQQLRRTFVFAASMMGSLFFYLATNTGSWISSSAYAKTFTGWIQALTIGLPGYPPTWTFFRNSLLSDLLFTALFVICISISREPEPHLHKEILKAGAV